MRCLRKVDPVEFPADDGDGDGGMGTVVCLGKGAGLVNGPFFVVVVVILLVVDATELILAAT